MLSGLVALVAAAQLAQLTAPPDISDALGAAMHQYSSEVALTVSPAGRIIRCATLVSGGAAAVDRALCIAMLKSTASAARTGDGRPAYGEIYSNIHSDDAAVIAVPPNVELDIDKLPAGLPVHPQTTVILTIDPTGRVIACDVKLSSGSAQLDKAACKSGPSVALPQPVKDEGGAQVLTVKMFKVGFAS